MTNRYEIKITGRLSERWADYFDGLLICPLSDDETLLTGVLPDQAALHGVRCLIQNIGLELISVNRVYTDEGLTHHEQ